MLTDKEKLAAKIIAKQPEEYRDILTHSFELFFSQDKIPKAPSLYSDEWVREVEDFIDEFFCEIRENARIQKSFK